MVTLHFERTHPNLNFWIRWMLTSIAGVVAYMLIVTPIAGIFTFIAPPESDAARELPQWLGIILSALGMGAFGATIGLVQWLILRRVLKGTGWWVLATIVGYSSLSISGWVLPIREPPWLVGMSMFLTLGLVFGVAQWFVLRGRVEHAGWWVAISIAGWMLAFALTGIALLSGLYVEPFDMLAAFLVPTAVSGAGLVWLLQSTRYA